MHIKLLHAATAPLSRKVLVVAHELGIAEWIEVIPVDRLASPADPLLAAANPLMEVPAVILEDGTSLYDAHLIADYLAWLAEDEHLFPIPAPESWKALQRQVLADGVAAAAALILVERRLRPDILRWQGWIDLQAQKLRQGLDELEQQVDEFNARPAIGEIAAGCLLAFLDLEMPDELWRDTRPRLSRWYEGFALRPSMIATRPPPV